MMGNVWVGDGFRVNQQKAESLFSAPGVEEEKEFGGGLAVWGGRNRAEGGKEDGCGGERGKRETDGSTPEMGF
ncbi:hypothetical protein ACLB2K_020939 [Fragaria x ananassa]